ncbi:MAG: stage II sporulation protein R [Clostridia bacterium]|nr:stage II sporulation protein R [Clostridia bacterium]
MKKGSILFSALAILLATLFMAAMPTEAEGAVYEDTVRLHILAASDSEEDQALKLGLRDALLGEYGEVLKGAVSKEGATELLRGELDSIAAFSEELVRESGYTYPVSVTLGEEWYDTRDYGDFSLPSGIYTSLIVRIGEGEGKNWWCVMYPPLCLDVATEPSPPDDAAIGYTDEEVRLISGKGYRIKFKLLELFSDAFS